MGLKCAQNLCADEVTAASCDLCSPLFCLISSSGLSCLHTHKKGSSLALLHLKMCFPGGASVQLLLIPAVVSMGSADHRLNLAEILSQNYGVREEREEDDTQEKQKSLEELEKSFSASQVKAAGEGK